ncbi:MAG TPA: S-methyl-5-thioribose-1-phosphate isomerase [Acidimicrobiales bacterium]|nr:S-methyl-5-thioribose-1-phosphate isomerase [Acidimicrobiales bacterium]
MDDDLLPFLLKPENLARIEGDAVLIGDRRRYPFAREFVRCETVDEVAEAIRAMVTQGSGPWVAAAHAMILAARRAERESGSDEDILIRLRAARDTLVATRPTNTAMARRLDDLLAAVRSGLESGIPATTTIPGWIRTTIGEIYTNYRLRARFGADMISDGDGVLTNCFGEAAVVMAAAMAVRDGKDIVFYTPETRPYLQGARLTAPSLREVGVPVKLITDNMPAAVMDRGLIQVFMTASDLITLDGHVVNKIGTYQSAVVAHRHGIPFFPFAWGRDDRARSRDDIVVEERDPAEVRTVVGHPTTTDDIDAFYPTFDITPPELVAGVITVSGVLSPYDLHRHRRF